MSVSYDDSALLLPVLEELSTAGLLPSRIVRGFVSRVRRGVPIPTTVGDLRHALRQPGTPQLSDIPQLGPVGITRLRTLFLGDERPDAHRRRQVGGRG